MCWSIRVLVKSFLINSCLLAASSRRAAMFAESQCIDRLESHKKAVHSYSARAHSARQGTSMISGLHIRHSCSSCFSNLQQHHEVFQHRMHGFWRSDGARCATPYLLFLVYCAAQVSSELAVQLLIRPTVSSRQFHILSQTPIYEVNGSVRHLKQISSCSAKARQQQYPGCARASCPPLSTHTYQPLIMR